MAPPDVETLTPGSELVAESAVTPLDEASVSMADCTDVRRDASVPNAVF